MELYFLGTGAGMPSKERNVTSTVLTLYEERGGFWMFDCGEGTQHQMMKSPLKASKLEKLFVTHLHGDHIYGIPGLLTSRSSSGAETPLTVYGPQGLRRYLEVSLSVSDTRINYPLDIVEIEEGVVFADDQFEVSARKVEHRIASYGYRIREFNRPGTLRADQLQAAGVPFGPLYGRIKRGENVQLADGRTIEASAFIGPTIPGRVVAIIGDTKYTEVSAELALDADVVVHEATFSDEFAELADKYYHATAGQAAQIAKKSNAGTLILTHISSRFQDGEVDRLLEEAKAIFPRTHVSRDLWSFPVDRKVPDTDGGVRESQ